MRYEKCNMQKAIICNFLHMLLLVIHHCLKNLSRFTFNVVTLGHQVHIIFQKHLINCYAE